MIKEGLKKILGIFMLVGWPLVCAAISVKFPYTPVGLAAFFSAAVGIVVGAHLLEVLL